MKRAISALEQLSDRALFETLAEGLPLIVDNAESFNKTARLLYRNKEYRASEIMQGFADEEASKVLILIDYVRCPKTAEQRAHVLERFYDHVAKHIYALACLYPSIASFAELSRLVESECRPWYLDGPNRVDWILPNSVLHERENSLYVDYVMDVTDTAGACSWTNPATPMPFLSQYQESDCVKLVQFLSSTGALSVGGLAEIADVWRGFTPAPDTDRNALRHLIGETLGRLELLRCGAVEEAAARFIVSHWPFPLWPLTVKVPRKYDNKLINDLREKRDRAIELIEETEAKRDPPPPISRATVEDMSNAHAKWERDVQAHSVRSCGTKSKKPQVRRAIDTERDYELASYAHVKEKLAARSDEERVALVALGWFGRERMADWPRTYEHATDMTPHLCDVYQIGLGGYWLLGLDRWESKPAPFSAGQCYHP